MKSSRGLIIVLCVLLGLLVVLIRMMGGNPAELEHEHEHEHEQQGQAKMEPTIMQKRKATLEKICDPEARNWDLDAKLKTVTTPTGLKYQDVLAGGGTSTKAGDKILVDYVGWLVDGRMFDTSMQEGRVPMSFILGTGNVIKGWDEGLVNMKIGGTRRLVIPPELAYGELGAPPQIDPNATLVFLVRLLEVEPAGK